MSDPDGNNLNIHYKSNIWQSQQVCFMIGVLNLIGGIAIERPQKLYTKCPPFLKVNYIEIDDYRYDVKSITKEKIDFLIEKNKLENISDSVLKRRTKLYRIFEHLHSIMDIVNKTRFKIITENDKHTILIDKRSLNKSIVDGIVFDKERIKIVGSKIHEMLLEKLSHQVKLTVNEFCY